MSRVKYLTVLFMGGLLAGCAATLTPPSPEVSRVIAPDGKLRVGLYGGGPTSVIPGATPEETRGVGHDLGKELARRLGVAFQPVVYPSIGALIKASNSGEWDLTLLAVLPEREKQMTFTRPFLFVEHGYMVPPGSTLASMADIDRHDVRIGAPEGGSVNAVLKRVLKHATVVNSAGLAGGLEMLKTGKVDAFAANKANLYELSDKLPGSRVLPGRLDLDRIALATPKGREAGMSYLSQFIQSANSEGLVTAAVKRASLRGTVDE